MITTEIEYKGKKWPVIPINVASEKLPLIMYIAPLALEEVLMNEECTEAKGKKKEAIDNQIYWYATEEEWEQYKVMSDKEVVEVIRKGGI